MNCLPSQSLQLLLETSGEHVAPRPAKHYAGSLRQPICDLYIENLQHELHR